MKVTVRGNNIEGALRLFRRKVTDSGLLFQYKKRCITRKIQQSDSVKWQQLRIEKISVRAVQMLRLNYFKT